MTAIRRSLFLVALVLPLAACGPDTPAAERIAERIEAMKTALAEEDVGDFMAPLAGDFAASERALDRRAVRLLLRREFIARENLRARTHGLDIRLVGEDRAVATLRALVTGGSGLIPDDGEWLEFETGWRREDGDWVMISANWERTLGNH